ncbi:MAG: hypothetical protein KGL39_21005 [Patescibacteria group bacterium]|nr:hypothetical protein [Patescibacteria group bacterium]
MTIEILPHTSAVSSPGLDGLKELEQRLTARIDRLERMVNAAVLAMAGAIPIMRDTDIVLRDTTVTQRGDGEDGEEAKELKATNATVKLTDLGWRVRPAPQKNEEADDRWLAQMKKAYDEQYGRPLNIDAIQAVAAEKRDETDFYYVHVPNQNEPLTETVRRRYPAMPTKYNNILMTLHNGQAMGLKFTN